MKAKFTLRAAVIAVFAGVATAALAAADNAPTMKPETTETSPKAEQPAKATVPKKKAPAHSHTQEKTGGSPPPAATADATKKPSNTKLHRHDRDAK